MISYYINKHIESSVFRRVVSCCRTLAYALCFMGSHSANQLTRRRDGGFEREGVKG
jgi:hypothetical protein